MFLPFRPVPTLTVATCNDVTVTRGGLLSWITSVADAAAPREAPAPGEDRLSGMVTSLRPGRPSFTMRIGTDWLVTFGPKLTVPWNAATSGPPGLASTTGTGAPRLSVRVRMMLVEPASTFATNWLLPNWMTAGGATSWVVAWAEDGVGWRLPALSVATL